MGYYCTVPQCTSLAGKTKNVKFHRFPRDESMADRWNIILKRGKPYTKYSKVCSLHFTQADYNVTTMGQWKTLSKDAVPSQNLPKLNPDGSVMVIRKSRTVRYREGRSKDGKDSFEIKQEPKWSHMMSAVMQQCDDPHDVAYRLQTLSAIASTLSPQPPHTPHPVAASTPSSSHNHSAVGPKPKKQDAFMQTDPVNSEEDDTMPNNSYSEASDTSYNSSEHLDYPYKDKDTLTFNSYQKDKEYLTYPKEGQDKPYTEQGKDYASHSKEFSQGKDFTIQTGKDYPSQGKDFQNQTKDYTDKSVSYQDKYEEKAYLKEYQSHSSQVQEKYSEKYSMDKNYPSQEKYTDAAKSYQEQGKEYPNQGKDYPSQGKDYPSPKDYTSTKSDDFMPQTNEEYNKEAEKYALERKSHNSYEKIPETYQKNIENGYQKQPENFQKDLFQKPDNPFQKADNPFQKPDNIYQKEDPFRKLENAFQKGSNPFQKDDVYRKPDNPLFHKSDNPFQKPDNGYQKITDMYPNYDKDYQRPEYYQNGYQDTVELLRNQQHNLEMLQQQHRTDNGFFNENHIKQEVDLNSEEEKFMYERTKDQLADASMYGGARGLSQHRLLEHLQQQLKREPGGCEPLMQPDGSPYYPANGHNNIPAGYYGEMGRPGPELLIAKQNALAQHTQLWQNSMKRPFFYSDNPHYTGPQLLHRYEDLTRILQ